MTLIDQVVPAIRQARIPLLSGYIWLLLVYLTLVQKTELEDVVAEEANAGGLLPLSLDAINVFSGLGEAVVLSALAYFLGTLVQRILSFESKVDNRALRERTAQLYAEAELRLQLAIPIAIGSIVLTMAPQLRVGLGVVAGTLAVHGGWLWREARLTPLARSLAGIDLSYARLRNVGLRYADLSGSNLQGASLREASCVGSKFDGANLEDSDFSRADCSEASFVESNLREANFYRAQIQNTSFRFADLRGANFRRSKLAGADFEGALLAGSNFAMTQLASVKNISILELLKARSIRGADLSNQDLSGLDFSYSILGGTLDATPDDVRRRYRIPGFMWAAVHSWSPDRFYGRRIKAKFLKLIYRRNYVGLDPRHILPGAILAGSDLTGANLAHARMAGTYLIDADLTGADLTDADLSGADISGANFSEANLGQAVFHWARWSKSRPPTWPQGYDEPVAKSEADSRWFDSGLYSIEYEGEPPPYTDDGE